MEYNTTDNTSEFNKTQTPLEVESTPENIEKPELFINENSKTALKTTSSWASFYSVILFISAGFVALSGLLFLLFAVISPFFPSNDIFSTGILILLGVLYVGLGIVLFFPALYLFRFSQRILTALQNNDSNTLEEALVNMKSYWKFMGIMTIVIIGLYILMIPIMIIVFAVGAF